MVTIKMLPINWSLVIVFSSVFLGLMYLLTGENALLLLFNYIVENHAEPKFLITIFVMITMVVTVNRVKYNEIISWLEEHALTLCYIKARAIFDNGNLLKGFFYVQYIVTAKDESGKQRNMLFQFGFRNITNPKVTFLLKQE